MLTSYFDKLIRKLNPVLRVEFKEAQYSREGDRITGLYCGNLHVCSVPLPNVEEHTTRVNGAIKHQGYHDILVMLVTKGCLDQRKTERLFGIGLGNFQKDLGAMKLYQEHAEEYRRKM